MRDSKRSTSIVTKRILPVVLAVLLSWSLVAAVPVLGANIDFTITFLNTEDPAVTAVPITISGTVPSGTMSFVSIVILRANQTVPTAASILHATEIRTDVNGSFTYVFPHATTLPPGTYRVRVAYEGQNGVTTQSYNFYPPGTVDDLLTRINNAANANALTDILVADARVLGVDVTLFDDLSLTEQRVVGELMFNIRSVATNGRFANAELAGAAFREAFGVYSVRAAVSASAVESALRTFFDFSTFPTYATFSGANMTTAGRNAALAGVGGRADYMREADIRTFFADRVLVSAIQHASSHDWVPNILRNNNDILNLNFASYDALTPAQRNAVNIALVGVNHTNIAGIRTAFNAAVATAGQPPVTQQPPISGGPGQGQGPIPGLPGGNQILVTDPPEREDPPWYEPTVSHTFVDTAGVPWAVDSIELLYELGVVAGYPDGTFRPNNNVTREEFITLLVRTFQLQDDAAEVEFYDVGENDWFYRYISAAVYNEITLGMGDGTFGIGQNITRQDMAVMAQRMISTFGLNLPNIADAVEFYDADDIADYATAAVVSMQRAGIITGMPDGTFAPSASATRAQAVVILGRLVVAAN